MKSLLSVVIVLMVGSAQAQQKTTAPTPQQTPASPTSSTPSPAPAQNVETPALATTPSATSATASQPDTANVETDGVVTEDEVFAPAADLSLPQGAMVNLGVTYFSREIDETVNAIVSTKGEFNSAVAELKGGYIFDFGLFAGLTAHYDTGKAAGQTISTYYAGPTVGYSDSYTGILINATYHLIGVADYDAAGKFDAVQGVQIDLSYPMAISDSLKFGPQLSWRKMSQKDSDTGAADIETKELMPFMGIWYIF